MIAIISTWQHIFDDAPLRSLDQGSVLSTLSDLTNLSSIWLDATSVSDLSPLSGLTDLRVLFLKGTPVSDLSPLSNRTELEVLDISQTAARDLRPLRELHKLVDDPHMFGLALKGCAAAEEDPRIAEIAEIKDNSERARVLFEYLADWVPPWEPAQPDELLSVEEVDGQLEVAASLPSEAEVEERLKQVLHAQLQDKAAALSRAAGNRFPKLVAHAWLLEQQVAPALAEVDLLQLHLVSEDLRGLHESGGEEEGEPFPVEVMIPLGEVLDRGPGLTLGNEVVDVLVERANRRAPCA